VAVDPRLMDVLVCPVTGAALEPLDPATRDSLNERVAAGSLRHVDGTPVAMPLEHGLVTRDRHTVYRVDDDIPVMLPDKGIPLESDTGA